MKPVRHELELARTKTVPDVIAPGLTVLFCGINPGLYTAFAGHHFARPGNRFWPTLYAAGFTPRLYRPEEDVTLPRLGLGITNLVARTTNTADELSDAEYREGGRILTEKVLRYTPRWVAFVGIGSYRTAYGRKRAAPGLQPETIGVTRLWVLPSPSGRNAHFKPEDFVRVYSEFRSAAFARQ